MELLISRDAGKLSSLYYSGCELFFGTRDEELVQEVREKTRAPWEIPFLFFEFLEDPDVLAVSPGKICRTRPEHVAAGFVLTYYRFPEDGRTIDDHVSTFATTAELAAALLSSVEFRSGLCQMICRLFPDAAWFWHVHIPRTAGSALRDAACNADWGVVSRGHIDTYATDLKQIANFLCLSNLQRDKILFSGHCELDDWGHLIRPTDTVVTFVRDPVDRVLSQFNHAADSILHASDTSPAEAEFFLAEGIDANDFEKSYRAPLLAGNLQCRLLARSGTATDALRNAASRGCQIYPTDCATDVISRMIGEPPAAEHNHASRHIRVADLPAALLRRIRDDNAEDALLFREAVLREGTRRLETAGTLD